MNAGGHPCLFEWYSPRHDVKDSVNVHHMCDIGLPHPHRSHHCPCGATYVATTTMTGRVITDEDMEAWADEAEQGYDVSKLRERPSRE